MNKKCMRAFLILSLCGWLLIGLVACGKEKEKSDGNPKNKQEDTNLGMEDTNKAPKILSFQLKNEPISLDPRFTANVATTMVTSNILEGLLTYEDTNLTLKPALAESWEISDDGLFYTFYLRKQVLFHNGTPMDASSVVKSFQNLKNNPLSETAWSKKLLDVLVTVEEMGPYTVRVQLKYPYTPFLSSLAMNTVSPIVLFEEEENADGNLIVKPLGTGPFKFSEWKLGEEIKLVKNEFYWGEKPKLDGIVFKVDVFSTAQAGTMLRNGEIDIIDLDKEREKGEGVFYYQSDSLMTSYIALNTDRYPFNILENRLAFAHALNRRGLFDKYYSGIARFADSYILPEILGYDSRFRFYPYSLDTARQYRKPSSGYMDEVIALDITFQNPGFSQEITDGLKRIGFDAKFSQNIDEAELYRVIGNGEYDMFMFAWQWGIADPDVLMEMLDQNQWSQNVSKYMNRELKALGTEGHSLPNGPKREEVYKKIQEILKKDAVLIPMFYPSRTYAYNDRVMNFRVHPNGSILFAQMDVK
jgi:peptide/nickel transport system substrate-binding protein